MNQLSHVLIHPDWCQPDLCEVVVSIGGRAAGMHVGKPQVWEGNDFWVELAPTAFHDLDGSVADPELRLRIQDTTAVSEPEEVSLGPVPAAEVGDALQRHAAWIERLTSEMTERVAGDEITGCPSWCTEPLHVTSRIRERHSHLGARTDITSALGCHLWQDEDQYRVYVADGDHTSEQARELAAGLVLAADLADRLAANQ